MGKELSDSEFVNTGRVLLEEGRVRKTSIYFLKEKFDEACNRLEKLEAESSTVIHDLKGDLEKATERKDLLVDLLDEAQQRERKAEARIKELEEQLKFEQQPQAWKDEQERIKRMGKGY